MLKSKWISCIAVLRISHAIHCTLFFFFKPLYHGEEIVNFRLDNPFQSDLGVRRRERAGAGVVPFCPVPQNPDHPQNTGSHI